MKIGTKSLLFGLHQFAIHPTFVTLGWIKLYHQLPTPKEQICIIIHDWGYWGKPNIDGIEGEEHPEWAAKWAERHLDTYNEYIGKHSSYYSYLCLFHSSSYAKYCGHVVSSLYGPDKYGCALMPVWLMTLLGWLSGETNEIRHTEKYQKEHPDKKLETLSGREIYNGFQCYFYQKMLPQIKAYIGITNIGANK